MLEELETVEYISLMLDTSNLKHLKSVHVLDHYFIPRKGVQTKVTEFHNFKGEIADVLTTYIIKLLLNYKL
jgi:hypothetical protein